MKQSKVVKLTAIGAIFIIALACIITDTDHGLVYTCVIALAGLAGYFMGRRNNKA